MIGPVRAGEFATVDGKLAADFGHPLEVPKQLCGT